jgi:uncharacterized protein (DUF1697 family)
MLSMDLHLSRREREPLGLHTGTMTRCIAFLRAVNVGGRTVKMEVLRAEFEALGLSNSATFIASGNVIFDSRERDLTALERKIEARLQCTFGFEIDTFVRTLDELAATIEHVAFDAAAIAAASTHVVGFLATGLDAEPLQTIMSMSTDIDRFHVHGRELHWLSNQKQSESKFSNAAFERALKVRSTFRGMNTLRKLHAKIVADN